MGYNSLIDKDLVTTIALRKGLVIHTDTSTQTPSLSNTKYHNTTMGKRDFDEADDGEIQEKHEAKRPKKQNSKSRQHQHSGIDPTWGQKYVFSGSNATTIPPGEESDFEDDADAMAYLNSVRYDSLSNLHVASLFTLNRFLSEYKY